MKYKRLVESEKYCEQFYRFVEKVVQDGKIKIVNLKSNFNLDLETCKDYLSEICKLGYADSENNEAFYVIIPITTFYLLNPFNFNWIENSIIVQDKTRLIEEKTNLSDGLFVIMFYENEEDLISTLKALQYNFKFYKIENNLYVIFKDLY